MVRPTKTTGRPLRDIAGTALYLPVRAVLPAMSEAQTDPTPVRQEQAVAPGLQRLRLVGTATAKTVTVGAEGLQVVLMAAASEAAPVEAVSAVTGAQLPRQLRMLRVPEEIAAVDLAENAEAVQTAQSSTEIPGAVSPAQQERRPPVRYANPARPFHRRQVCPHQSGRVPVRHSRKPAGLPFPAGHRVLLPSRPVRQERRPKHLLQQ